MLNIGDKVIYPMYGAGTVEEIKKQKILGENKNLVKLKLIHSDMEIFVPIEKIEENCIRKIPSSKEMKNCISILKTEKIKMTDEEYKLIMEELNTVINESSLKDIAEWLVKLVTRRRVHGQLNSNEKKLYITFKSLFTGIWALSEETDYKETEKKLDKIFRTTARSAS